MRFDPEPHGNLSVGLAGCTTENHPSPQGDVRRSISGSRQTLQFDPAVFSQHERGTDFAHKEHPSNIHADYFTDVALVVESIRKSGLKKPIQVTLRTTKTGEEPLYDLICGQGRKEAFESLGFTQIPAIIVEADKETSMLMSLVENMVRRTVTPQDLVEEILRLKTQGYNNVAIGRKLDISDGTVAGLLTLNNGGEERLIYETMNGKIPLGVAIEIAKAETKEQQREFLSAYENGHINQEKIRVVRRVLAQRNAFSKKLKGYPGANKSRTAERIIDTLKKETQRQKSLVRKTQICDARRIFVVEAFRNLFADDDFLNLLRAEGVTSVPKELDNRTAPKN